MANDGDSHDSARPGSRDVALIHGVTPDGDLKVIRQRADQIEVGAVRPLREGVPITGEVVRLTPRKDFPLLCDVTTELAAPAPKQDVAESAVVGHKGPAQVATNRYRENWDAIWSRPTPKGEVLN